jgi:hypothetical protein
MTGWWACQKVQQSKNTWVEKFVVETFGSNCNVGGLWQTGSSRHRLFLHSNISLAAAAARTISSARHAGDARVHTAAAGPACVEVADLFTIAPLTLAARPPASPPPAPPALPLRKHCKNGQYPLQQHVCSSGKQIPQFDGHNSPT